MTAKRHGGACAWPSRLTVHSINRLHCGSLRYTADASSIISDQCEKSEDHQPVGHSRHMPDRSKREHMHQSMMQFISPHHEIEIIRPGCPGIEKIKLVPKTKDPCNELHSPKGCHTNTTL